MGADVSGPLTAVSTPPTHPQGPTQAYPYGLESTHQREGTGLWGGGCADVKRSSPHIPHPTDPAPHPTSPAQRNRPRSAHGSTRRQADTPPSGGPAVGGNPTVTRRRRE
ncbi:hypothetical protein GCM10010341_15910 [Streptomyces noursei]|nr:hypothetical protein GCM10010341_15910 [Streptomyces noursei]